MNKKAAIKSAVRNFLVNKQDKSVTLSRPFTNVASVSVGVWAKEFIFSEYDDNGDPSTESEYDDIYSELETIVNEHNG